MAVVKGSQESLGMQSLMADVGLKAKLEVRSDATAAIGMVARIGLGKVRHLSVSDLWVQHVAKDGRIRYSKLAGSQNPADLLTKSVGRELLVRHCNKIGAVILQGRSGLAPQRRLGESDRGSRISSHGGFDCARRKGGAVRAGACEESEGKDRMRPSPSGSSVLPKLTVATSAEKTYIYEGISWVRHSTNRQP